MNKDSSYLGHETWQNALRMYIKMVSMIIVYSLIIHILLFALVVYLYMEKGSVVFLVQYVKVRWIDLLFTNPLVSINQDSFYETAVQLIRQLLVIFIACGMLIYIITIPVFLKYFARRAKEQVKETYVRGARTIDVRELGKYIKKDKEAADLPFGPIRLPKSAEVKHTLVIGSPGVGKTNMISQTIERLKERKETIIIYDYKGDYVSKFYDPRTDMIFNPLDKRCIGWTVMNEITRIVDVDAVAHSLIPYSYQQDPYWSDGGRDVLSGLLHYLYQNNAKTNADIWAAVTSPISDISAWLKNTKGGERGYVYIQDASSKQAISIISVVMQYVKSFEYMAKADGPFCISEWLNRSNGGALFITGYADIKDTLKPILSLAVDLMGRKLLSMKDDYQRRVFFILDEFPTLQRLSTIKDLLTGSRSKGGAVIVGTQDKGAIDKIYSPEYSQSILNACGNSVIFRVSDPTTARYLAERIGRVETLGVEHTLSAGVENNRDGISLMQRSREKDLTMPSELQNLRDLEAYLKIANYPVAKVKFEFEKYPDRHESFTIREDLMMDNVIMSNLKD